MSTHVKNIMNFLTGSNTIILIFFIIIGALLRLYKLGADSFSSWEICSFPLSLTASGLREFLYGLQATKHAPVYFLFFKWWSQFFGGSEFALRLPSLVFGIASIPLLYQIGKNLFGPKVGLISAFMLTVSVEHILYSREARMYALFILLTLLTVYFFLRALSKNRNIYWVFYAISGLVLLHTHNFAVFVLLFLNIYFLFCIGSYKKYIRPWTLSNLVIGLLYSPWFLIMLGGFGRVDWIAPPSLNALFLLLIQFTTGKLFYVNGALINNYYIKEYTIEIIMVFVFLFLLILGIWGARSKRKVMFFLSLWLFLPVSIVYFISSFFVPMLESRFLIFSLAPYLLLVANGISRLRPKIIQFLLLGFLFLYALLNIGYCWATKDGCYREAFTYLKKNRGHSETQYFASAVKLDHVFAYYYPEHAQEVLYININELGTPQGSLNFKESIKEKNNIRLFCFNLADKELGLLLENLQGYRFVERKLFSGRFSIKIEILHFVK